MAKLTAEQISEHKNKRLNGVTIEALMKEYSITKMAVYYHLDGIRINKIAHKENPLLKQGSWNTPKLTPEQVQELNHKHRNGQKMEALAKEYSLSKITVYKYLERSKQNRINHQENPPPKTKNLLDMFLFGAFSKPEA